MVQDAIKENWFKRDGMTPLESVYVTPIYDLLEQIHFKNAKN